MKSKLKFVFSVLCSLCLFLSVAIAENATFDLSAMTVDELLELRDQVDSELQNKGYVVYFDIERGSKGEAVSNIQQKLTELGFYSGKISGKFDSETQKAFKAFEKANGLECDGVASRNDQVTLFSDGVVAKASHTVQPTEAPVSKGRDSASEHDSSFDYEQCMRYPDDHRGETYKLKGKVEQTLGNRSDGFQLRFSVLGNSDEIIYVYVNDDPGYNILENDWLIVDVTMAGTITYESVWGREVTIPSAIATSIELR